METLEFLGGKYQKTEQIVPGPVQTFRAREAGTGREVFVHRVSCTEEQAQQTALLRMLTTVLLRSSEARKLVLDFGDDQGFWYVVTESEPRCLILREWLQFELNRAAGSPSGEERAPVNAVPKQSPAVKPQGPQPDESEPGEFTRMFSGSLPKGSKSGSPPSLNEPEKPAVSPPPPASAPGEPGEFTRVFRSFTPQAARPEHSSTPAAAPNAPNEPGEFTRFFQEGLPRPADKAARGPEIKRGPDKPSRGGFVQRPHTPMPPVSQKASEPGEFTRMFSQPNAEAPKSENVFADYPNPKPDSPGPVYRTDTPKPLESDRQEPGEYTKIFGPGVSSPAEQQPQGPIPDAAAAPVSLATDDPLRGTKPLGVPQAAPSFAPKGPSEYTMVIQGNRPVGDAGPPPAPSGGPPNLALPKIPAIPQVKAPALNVPKPPALPAPAQAAAVTAPSNKKLILFFAILAVLSIVLILLVVLIAVKK